METRLKFMVFQRYEIIEDAFHNITIKDNIKQNRKYGKFNQYERTQLEYFCDHLNIENQTAQDFEDHVYNVIVSAIESERTCLGRNVLLQLAEEIGIELDTD